MKQQEGKFTNVLMLFRGSKMIQRGEVAPAFCDHISELRERLKNAGKCSALKKALRSNRCDSAWVISRRVMLFFVSLVAFVLNAASVPPLPPMPGGASVNPQSALRTPQLIVPTNLPHRVMGPPRTNVVFACDCQPSPIICLKVVWICSINLRATNRLVFRTPWPTNGGPAYLTNSLTNFPALFVLRVTNGFNS